MSSGSFVHENNAYLRCLSDEVQRCEGHSDTPPPPPTPPPHTHPPRDLVLASIAQIVTLQAPASDGCDLTRSRSHAPLYPLPLQERRLCRCRHMFHGRLSYMEGKGESCPTVSFWQRAPPHQGTRQAVVWILVRHWACFDSSLFNMWKM